MEWLHVHIRKFHRRSSFVSCFYVFLLTCAFCASLLRLWSNSPQLLPWASDKQISLAQVNIFDLSKHGQGIYVGGNGERIYESDLDRQGPTTKPKVGGNEKKRRKRGVGRSCSLGRNGK